MRLTVALPFVTVPARRGNSVSALSKNYFDGARDTD